MKKFLFVAMLLMAFGLTVKAQETAEDPDVKYASDLLRPGTVAPEFVINFTDTARNIPLSKFRGHYVVLDFWASWCPDCRKDIAKVRKLNEEFHKRGVAFIGISFDTNRETWKNCIMNNGMNWLHYSELKKWKKETKIDRDYHINWIPTYYIIDPDGKVLLGTVVLDKVEDELNRLYKEGFLEKSSESLDKVMKDPRIASFPGGGSAYQEFLVKNLNYPSVAMKYGAEGKVKIMFEVAEDGTLGNFEAKECTITDYNKAKFDKLTTARQNELKKAISLAFAKEAYNVMKKMPAWIPGKHNGVPVRSKHTNTVTFRLTK